MKRLSLFLVALFACCLLDRPQIAAASCNLIPDASTVTHESIGLEGEGKLASRPVGYKGALGRITPVFAVLGRSRAFTVIPDGAWIGETGPAAKVNLDDLGKLAIFMQIPAQDPEKPAHLVAYVDPNYLDQTKLEAALSSGNIRLLEDASFVGVRMVKLPGADGIVLPVREVPLSEEGDLIMPRIVVAQDAKQIVQGGALLHVLQTPCSDLKATERQQLLACIDTIYAESLGIAGGVVTALTSKPITSDPVPCAVQIARADAPDFTKVCDEDRSGKNQCANPPNTQTLQMWQDVCGGVHIPFDWTIIQPARVNGYSALGRKNPAHSNQVELPGREFVGSTPVEDFCGSAPTTDWRRPAIDLATKVNRFGLTGTTHEPDSIVSIFPRIPVGAICKLPAGEPENACFGVEVNTTDPEKHRAVCACDRDQPNPCDCTAPEAGRRYFVCDSGTSAGRPCTRDEHCRPADCTPTDSRPECKPRCDGTPTCQDSGEVWSHPVPNIKTVCKPNATDPNNNCCWTDADCDGRGNKKQCGHALFDLTEARTSGHVITLDWAVKVGGPKRRGVCGDGTPCDNDAPGPSCPDCRGYSPGIE